MTRLYVGNLPYSITEESLKGLFASFGNVTSASIITDRETGRSKGFGFVELEEDAAGEAAIKDLNGKDVDGRSLVVSVARPKTDAPRRSFGGDRNGGPRRDFGRGNRSNF